MRGEVIDPVWDWGERADRKGTEKKGAFMCVVYEMCDVE